jgi:DNA-binding transcriptional LysR family regulator
VRVPPFRSRPKQKHFASAENGTLVGEVDVYNRVRVVGGSASLWLTVRRTVPSVLVVGRGLIAGVGMELRQLRYFVTLAEELHFGRAAEREHIVQSALSQQLQRLERELGARLLNRTTHNVTLTPVGSNFLIEARRILAHVSRATAIARRAACTPPPLWVGTPDASYNSMPQILRKLQVCCPNLEIHQIEASVPEQFKLLGEGKLDIGFGRAALAPPEVASELIRIDAFGVLIPKTHCLSESSQVPVAALGDETLLLPGHDRAPEFNQFVFELCRSAGFVPRAYPGSVQSIRAALDLVSEGRCLACVPSSCAVLHPEIIWKRLIEPVSYYPWSLLWRSVDHSPHSHTVLSYARQLSQQRGWLGGTEAVEN